MKGNKDISDLFKKNEHKLQPKPSADAWSKLERKLDAHSATQGEPKSLGVRKLWVRRLSIAASVAVLIGAVAVIRNIVNSNEDSGTFAQAPTAPYSTKVLSDADDFKTVEFTRDPMTRGREIVEGDFSKKLKVNERINPEYQVTDLPNTHIAEATYKDNSTYTKADKAALEKLAAADKHSHGSSGSATQLDNNDYADAKIEASKPIAVTDATTDDEAFGDVAYQDAEVVIAEGTMMEAEMEEDIAIAEKVEESYAKKEKASRAKTQAPPAPASRTAVVEPTYNTSENAVSYEPNVVSSDSDINQFQWLIGNWQGTVNDNQTIEEWQQTNAYTIEGKGTLIINGQTTFTESMKIEKIGEHLYYIVAIDENQQPVKFKLKSFNSQQAVFENNINGVSNQVVIRQLDANNFSTEILNNSNGNLNATQQDYLSNRNVIIENQNQVKRTLKRN